MTAPAYRIGGQPVDAGRFYAVACDPRRSVVVEACAGAGKTWMLVSRIVRALLDGAQPQQVLAITFTRKAAGEMRARLDEWLVAFSAPASDAAARTVALRERGLGEAEAAALAPALGQLQQRLLDAGRAVEVRTFHGWFAQLVAHAPLQLLDQLGLPPGAELIEDTEPLRPALFRAFQRAVQADDSLRADYLALVRRHRRGTLMQWLDAAWQRCSELERAAAAGTLDDAVPPAAALWPECAGLADPRELLQRPPLRDAVDALARALAGLGRATPAKAATRLRAALAAGDAAAGFSSAWDALFTARGEARKKLGAAGLPVGERLLQLREMARQQQAHDDHRRMTRLARVLLAEFAALKRRRGLADMGDLERAALAMLGDSAVAGWVQERLDQRLRHLLIDEFQDTSPLQWQALHGWLSSYAGAGGSRPSVFIVGDPKQSIYRFRRAEPRVFDAARRFVVEGLGGEVLECDHTRRNAPAVLAALNAVFGDAARADGWVPFRAHTTGAAGVGAVLALPGVARPARDAKAAPARVWRDSLTEPRREAEVRLRQQEAATIADGVAELVAEHGVRPGDVMVLSRKRSTLHRVADELARRRLPYVAPESVSLAESPEALDLAALLDALASPGHDLSLARALKSPLFGAGDDDLLWLMRESRRCGRSWLASLVAATAPPGSVLPRAQRLLSGWLREARELPPHDLLDRVVHQGEWLPRLAAAAPAARRHAALQAVQALLGAALEHDAGRYATLYAFVRAFKAGVLRAAGAAPADAVQLLTVHGAKGLQARAVFVADADPEPRPGERATLLVDWPVDAAAPRRVAFVASEAQVPASLAALLAEELAARRREELNGLYVAATRACEWLVFGHTEPRYPPPVRSWWQRVEPHATHWQPAPAGSGVEAAPSVESLPPLVRRVEPPPRQPAAEAPAARLGQAVHRALEWIGQPLARPDRAEWPAVAAVAAATFDADAAAVLGAVGAVLDSPACARFFGGPALRWAGNEVPLADAAGSMRVDRLVRLEEEGGAGVWWVLDYKLGAAPAELPAYREQMARYLQALRAAQPGDAVRGAFITGGGVVIEI